MKHLPKRQPLAQQIADFTHKLNATDSIAQLFSCLSNTHFFAKDTQGRFMACDDGFVQMLRGKSKAEILGKTDFDFIPQHIAEAYTSDDRQVMQSKTPLLHRTEVVPTDELTLDWHVSNKFPLLDDTSTVFGIVGITSKLTTHNLPPSFNPSLYSVLDYIGKHYGEKITLAKLAQVANQSERTLERHFLKCFETTPLRYIKKVRINAACHALTYSSKPIAQIASECGFYDQSHMTGEFSQIIKKSPRAYRLNHRKLA